MQLRRSIKHNALRALAGAWGKSITVLFILALIIALFSQFEVLIYRLVALIGVESPIVGTLTLGSMRLELSALSLMVTTLSTLFGFFLLAPLALGMLRWYYCLSDGVQEDVTAVFYYFSNLRPLFRCWRLALLTAVLLLCWTVLLLAPGILVLLLSIGLRAGADPSEGVAPTFGLLIGLALLAVGVALLTLWVQRYKLAPYLAILHPDWPLVRCLRRSATGMRGHLCESWMLHLSFLPWMVLCLLALPILFVVPYGLQSHVIYARYRIERFEQLERRRAAAGDTRVFRREGTAEDSAG